MPKDENTRTGGQGRTPPPDQTLTGGVGRQPQGDQTLTGGGGLPSQGAHTLPQEADEAPQSGQTLTQGVKRGESDLTMTRTLGAGDGNLVEKPAWSIGDVIDGKYQVIDIVGQGGMGMVYRVNHREWHLELAVKVPLANLVADDTSKARFIREAQIWVDLGLHPNIVQCWYVRELGGVPRVFMDYIDGGSLKDWVARGRIKPGDWDLILDLMIQACDGLGYAYKQGVRAHRDVKPGNLLLTEEGQVRVTDFGIVKHETREDIQGERKSRASQNTSVNEETKTGLEVGTPEYGAPEQWTGSKHVDGRADIYALGGILFELCCGRRPFDDGVQREPAYVLIGRHLSTPAPDPRDFNSDVPDKLADIIGACLEKAPDKRPETMDVLRETFAQAFRDITGKSYRRAVPKAGELRSDALNNRAVSFVDLGRRDDAYYIWEQALKLDAYHAESIYNKALLEWIEGKITDDEVVRRLDEVKHSQTSRNINYYLGLIHLERAAADNAERELLQYAQLTQSGEAWRTVGDAQMAQEKYAEAGKSYEHALALVPEDMGCLERQTLASMGTRQYGDRIIFPWRRCIDVLSEGHTQSIRALALTTDGKAIISGGADGILQLWDLDKTLPVNTFERFKVVITSVAVTPEGKYMVSGDDDNTLCLWDLDTAKYLRFYEGHKQGITSVTVTSDGRYIISGSRDKTVRLWELATAKKLRRLTGHTDDVTSVAVSLGGGVIISGSLDRTIRLWEPRKGQCLKIFEGHEGGINTVALSVEGGCIVSGSYDNTVRIWDIETGQCLRTLKGHTEKVTTVAITPDGRFVLSGSHDRTLRLWDFATGKCLRTFKEHTDGITSLVIAPDGTLAFSGSDDSTIRMWNLDAQAQHYEAAIQVCFQRNLEEIQWSTGHFRQRMSWARTAWNEGKAVAAYKYLTQARSISGYERAPEALVLSATISSVLPRKRLLGEWMLWTFHGHTGRVRAVVSTVDGRFIISGSQDKTLKLWEIATGKCLRTFTGHTRGIQSVAVTPDGRFVLSGGDDNTVRLWDIGSATCLRVYEGHKMSVTSVTMTPHGQFVVSSSRDRMIKIWNPATTECLQTFKGHKKGVLGLAISPDRQFGLSGGEERTLRLWERARAKPISTLSGHKGSITCVTFAPNGEFAMSGSKDHTLKMWDVTTGQCLRTFEGHEDEIHGMALTSDSRFVVSASQDKTLRLWNCETGACLQILKGHALGVNSVTLTPDARYLASGSHDKTVKVWELDWELDTALKVTDPKVEEQVAGSHRFINRFTSFFSTRK